MGAYVRNLGIEAGRATAAAAIATGLFWGAYEVHERASDAHSEQVAYCERAYADAPAARERCIEDTDGRIYALDAILILGASATFLVATKVACNSTVNVFGYHPSSPSA